MEFFDDSPPRHRVGQASLVTELLLLQLVAVLGADRNPGIQFLRISGGEFGVETNVHTCQKILGIGCLDTAWIELLRTNLATEQRGSDQVFQIVVGLLLCLWLILVTEGSTTRDIDNPCFRFSSSVASSTGWPWIREQNFFRTVCFTTSRYGLSQSAGIV